jgi:exodeoxyribonuclease VII large subunit
MEDGLEVKAKGYPKMYHRRGQLTFQVQDLELAGEGSLKKAYELLKKKLEEEGLFDRKRPIPDYIKNIAVVTSRTGAVIGDFRKNLLPRGFHLSLFDVRVEGREAVSNILHAIQAAQKGDFEVLVIMRGGGSLEDMQAFNNELVARAVFASKIPTLCGIGHDRDVPIVSLVGDKATSTPSIAATVVNESWRPLEDQLPLKMRELLHSYVQFSSTLMRAPEQFAMRLAGAYELALQNTQDELSRAERYLAAVDPRRNLKLGYSILMKQGVVVKKAKDFSLGDSFHAILDEGEIDASITKII